MKNSALLAYCHVFSLLASSRICHVPVFEISALAIREAPSRCFALSSYIDEDVLAGPSSSKEQSGCIFAWNLSWLEVSLSAFQVFRSFILMMRTSWRDRLHRE